LNLEVIGFAPSVSPENILTDDCAPFDEMPRLPRILVAMKEVTTHGV
jgi:hypothetical protein